MDGMDGLLDFAKTPQGQGLLAAVAGGLTGARRGTPWNNAGRAGLAGLAGYSNAVSTQGVQELRDLQLKKLTQDQAAAAKKQGALDAFEATLPEDKRPLFAAAPEKYLENSPQFQKQQLVEVADPSNPLRTMKVWMKPGDAQGTTAGYGKLPEILSPEVQAVKLKIAAAGKSSNPTPYFQFLPTPDGYVAGNARTGMVAPVSINGAPVVRSTDSPSLQGDIAGAKEGGKLKVNAEAALPQSISNAEQVLKQADELVGSADGKIKRHPGFEQAVGGSSLFGVQNIPGTDAKDFTTRLDQLKGGAFLTAFQTLRGGGQITEVEGKKATDAIARMNIAQSEKEFVAAVRDYESVIRKAVNNSKMRAGRPVNNPMPPDKPAAAGGVIDFGSLP